MMSFLSAQADNFVAPLWTIECLLSDPAVAPTTDLLGVDLQTAAPAGTNASAPGDPVKAASIAEVEIAGDVWLGRIRPGDQAFFYMSSHGISDGSNALGLCEDVLSKTNKKWSQSLNVSTLATGLTTPLIGAARGWVFLDACQELVPSLLGRPTGLPGLHLIEFDVDMSTKARNTCGIAGSPVGGKAWAPTSDDPPFFTQALLVGLGKACVEAVPELGWTVTAARLMFDIPRVGEAALGRKGIETSLITTFNQPLVALLKVSSPMVPIALSTEVGAHMSTASVAIVCDDVAVGPATFVPPPAEDFVWRFEVPAHKRRTYTATATFEQNEPSYQTANFDPEPPCQFVRLRRLA